MRAVVRADAVRTGAVALVAVVGSLALAVLVPPQAAAPGIAFLAVCVLLRHRISSQRGLLVLVAATVVLVPAGRYSLVGVPGALPFRIVAAALAGGLFLSLALDRRVHWQETPFLRWVVAFVAVALLSVLVNVRGLALLGRVDEGALVVAQTALLCSLFVTTRQLVTSAWLADWLVRALVLAGAFVAVSVGWERISGTNVFTELHRVLPLQPLAGARSFARFGTVRALGSANHPIALSVALIMLVPMAVFLAQHSPWPATARRRQVLFLGCGFVMVLAAFLSGSRTFVVMLAAMALVLLLLDWTVLTRVLVGALPFGVAAAVVMPGPVLTIVRSFLSPSSLIESQYASAGMRGSGRLADLVPAMSQAQQHPVLGTGVGSRVVVGPETNAMILDDQYLSSLLEQGFLGLAATLALLVVPAVVMGRCSHDPLLSRGERSFSLALSCTFTAYAVAAALFDAFAFQQTFMLFLLLLAVASSTVATARRRRREAAAEPATSVPGLPESALSPSV